MRIIEKKNNDHNLSDLVGKTIISISMTEVDANFDTADVCQFYHINFSDGTDVVLACDGGGRGNQYATAELITKEDYDDMFIEEEEEEEFE